MEFVIISLVALIASGLTLFSGFGLGTLLVPVFVLFFPVDIAIALVAVVHFLNNLFKLALLGRYADRGVVLRFGIPAIFSAFIGAQALLWLSDLAPLIDYTLAGNSLQVTPVKIIIATLMVLFSLFEILPYFEKLSFSARLLPLGGVISGFFGGLSGQQGALRSAFLIKYGLSKETFIATGVVIAVLVDISRISAYLSGFSWSYFSENGAIILAATLAAFLGAFIGNRLVKKVTIRVVRNIVAVMLFGIAIALGMGII